MLYEYYKRTFKRAQKSKFHQDFINNVPQVELTEEEKNKKNIDQKYIENFMKKIKLNYKKKELK
jgi:hypothetical protein